MNEEYILGTIKAIIDKHGSLPRLASMTEIKRQVVDDALDIMRNLYKAKKISCHIQLNDFAIGIIEDSNNINGDGLER